MSVGNEFITYDMAKYLRVKLEEEIGECEEIFPHSYSVTTYSGETTVLSLTISPAETTKKAGLLLIVGEVNGASSGNSVYSIGLFNRGSTQPCKLISEQSGYEFTNVSVSYDSVTNTYTVMATTPNTNNCTYSMNVIF